MSRSNTPRFRRPIRFNRTRANPIQRLPFYRQSHAKTGDYWRMPEVRGHLMGREVGRVCSLAFVQAFCGALTSHEFLREAHLANLVLSAIEAHGGSVPEEQRGILNGFFGADSPLVELMRLGAGARTNGKDYEESQLEEALTHLSSLTSDSYGLLRDSTVASLIPESRSKPRLVLESPQAAPPANKPRKPD